MENLSPLPTTLEKGYALPICARCGDKLTTIKYLDYDNIRVVFHEGSGCGGTIGVSSNDN